MIDHKEFIYIKTGRQTKIDLSTIAMMKGTTTTAIVRDLVKEYVEKERPNLERYYQARATS